MICINNYYIYISYTLWTYSSWFNMIYVCLPVVCRVCEEKKFFRKTTRVTRELRVREVDEWETTDESVISVRVPLGDWKYVHQLKNPDFVFPERCSVLCTECTDVWLTSTWYWACFRPTIPHKNRRCCYLLEQRKWTQTPNMQSQVLYPAS